MSKIKDIIEKVRKNCSWIEIQGLFSKLSRKEKVDMICYLYPILYMDDNFLETFVYQISFILFSKNPPNLSFFMSILEDEKHCECEDNWITFSKDRVFFYDRIENDSLQVSFSRSVTPKEFLKIGFAMMENILK